MTPTSQLIVQLLSRKTQGSKEVGFCTWVEVFPAKKKPHTLQWVSNHVITSLLYLHFDDVYSRNRNKVRLFWRWCRRKHVIMSWSSLWNRCDTVNPRSSVAAEGWSWLTLLLSQPYIHFYYILYGFFLFTYYCCSHYSNSYLSYTFLNFTFSDFTCNNLFYLHHCFVLCLFLYFLVHLLLF